MFKQFLKIIKRNQIMQKYFFIIIILLLASCSKKTVLVHQLPKENFPQAWVGNWSGELSIYNAKGLQQKIPMGLEIQPTAQKEVFTWALIYGEDKEKGRRDYELNIKDAEKGWYVIDEKNSILLDCYLFHNKLYSRFEVMGNMLLCTYEKQGDQIIFEVISGKQEAVSTTGGKKVEEKDIPKVNAFGISVSQKGILKKR